MSNLNICFFVHFHLSLSVCLSFALSSSLLCLGFRRSHLFFSFPRSCFAPQVSGEQGEEFAFRRRGIPIDHSWGGGTKALGLRPPTLPFDTRDCLISRISAFLCGMMSTNGHDQTTQQQRQRHSKQTHLHELALCHDVTLDIMTHRSRLTPTVHGCSKGEAVGGGSPTDLTRTTLHI